jgi:hypothetical protein
MMKRPSLNGRNVPRSDTLAHSLSGRQLTGAMVNGFAQRQSLPRQMQMTRDVRKLMGSFARAAAAHRVEVSEAATIDQHRSCCLQRFIQGELHEYPQ